MDTIFRIIMVTPVYYVEVVFSNGCRAAPWRQVMGDICYISVQPFDGDPFCVTASTEGYYVNKVRVFTCTILYTYARVKSFHKSRAKMCVSLLRANSRVN